MLDASVIGSLRQSRRRFAQIENTFDGSQYWVIVGNDEVAGSSPASGSRCRGSLRGRARSFPVRFLSVGISECRSTALVIPPHWSFLSIRLLDAIDIDFLHLHHRLHDVFGLGRIFVVEIIEKNRRADLLGDAKFVRQPAASDFLAAGRKFVPERVHLLLIFAIYEQGNRQRKFVFWAAIERDESLSLKLERNG